MFYWSFLLESYTRQKTCHNKNLMYIEYTIDVIVASTMCGCYVEVVKVNVCMKNVHQQMKKNKHMTSNISPSKKYRRCCICKQSAKRSIPKDVTLYSAQEGDLLCETHHRYVNMWVSLLHQ